MQSHGHVARLEPGDRQVDDHRQGQDGDDRVDRGQADVQGHIAPEQVAVEIGRRPARRGRQQHHPDRQHRRQAEQQHQAETDGRQKQQLTGQGEGDRLGPLADAGEIAGRQVQAQPEHDDAQRDRQTDHGQR
ncbi:hypothetical protein D3C80_1674500 [compost metagenome]